MRKPFKPLVLAAFVAAAAAGPAFAEGDSGDNGMTATYGDSWANVQVQQPEAAPVPGLAAQEGAADARASWAHAREDMRARTVSCITTTTMAPAANPPDSQAAPAAYSGPGVAPGPAAIDAGAAAGGATSIPDRGGPVSPAGSSTNTVDPTGVGAATMGGSPYGGNQDPAKLPSQTGTH
jgi:hypothetical protein